MAVVCSGGGMVKPCMKCADCDKAARRIHWDITFVDRLPPSRNILVDQIRELKKDVIVVPNDTDRKAYVINDADTMNISAQNALLRILEEPPAHAVFILKTDNPSALLPTVRSRCVELKYPREPDAPGAAAMDAANEFVSALEQGNAALTMYMFRLEKLEKSVFTAFLDAARGLTAAKMRAALSGDPDVPFERLKLAESVLVKAGEMLDFNVNIGHISGMICATLMTTQQLQ